MDEVCGEWLDRPGIGHLPLSCHSACPAIKHEREVVLVADDFFALIA